MSSALFTRHAELCSPRLVDGAHLVSIMVAKLKIPHSEIKAALEEALQRREECAGMTLIRIFETDTGPANWDAEIVGKDGHVVHPECKRVVLAAKLGLQNRFDMAS